MRTIGRKWPHDAPRGDYTGKCDICGVAYRASQLEQKPGGAVACSRRCAKGRDSFTLDQLNAANAQQTRVYPSGPERMTAAEDDL